QANAAVTATVGGTSVLATVCMAQKPKEDAEFFPLMVEYTEKTYAAGRIPGGFFKREGRPTQKEVLTARLIDRPIRPLFPEGFYYDVVVSCTVLSSDDETEPDIIALIAASTALHISDIPYEGPVGVVRIGLVNDAFVVNPTYEQETQSLLDLVVVGLADGIVMIEGEATQLSEAKITEALQFAFDQLQPSREIQNEFRKKIGKPKADVELYLPPAGLKDKVAGLTINQLNKIYQIANKEERETALRKLLDEVIKDLSVFDGFKINDKDVTANHIKMILDQVEYEVVREMIFKKGIRADGRKLQDIRQITSEINVLPRTHGSSLFTRGQTQSLAVVTLGTKRDEQLIESLEGVSYQNFMLHYNFPPFSVGEARATRGPGRREIGHGALAAKALKAVLPTKDEFPYTIRVVSEILESNGSSSMASVCAGSLSLMAAGVPIKETVAGISIGLVSKNKDYRLLTDIMGSEDHFGDMDFKIAGTPQGITAIQLDLKIKGVPLNILIQGVEQAKSARTIILNNMQSVIAKPVAELSKYAPRILTTQVPQEKIGEVIGPGGKTIKKIIEATGVESIDIDDDGKVFIASTSSEAAEKALAYVKGLVQEPEVGKIYDAKVVKVTNFGAFVEFMPGRQGLVHVSELASSYVKDVASIVKVGDEFKVKLTEIDQMKRLNLSKKQAEQAEVP
ncbi:MAG: polyribonucleotide nucleotidyltransferase, partial [Candidatus Omnitrophota bacterium]|nr:polyribonucleotide nucleotidyltransferase [Candidatus Omnitrophota bacterium]